MHIIPAGSVINVASANFQLNVHIYANTITGASRFAVNSGKIWARVVSMLSTLSTMMLFSAPEGIDFTSPRGILVSLRHIASLILASTLKVAL